MSFRSRFRERPPHITQPRVLLMAAALICALAAMPARASAQGTSTDTQDDTHDPMPMTNMFIRGFGSVLWGATDKPDQPNSFTLGQFDMFITSNLGERTSVLAEIVFEGSISTHVETDVERLQITYRFNDNLIVSAGRYHTGIGFYNTQYHHGGFFETPIGRPRVFAFEDEGGVLPVHEVGVKANGVIPGTKSSLRYLIEVGNGRRWNFEGVEGDEVPHTLDQNGAKATNVGLSFRPDRPRGLDIGGSFYRDVVTDATDQPVNHRIGAVYVTYRTSTIEFLAEYLKLTHLNLDHSRQHDAGGYLQFSRAWGKWRPYYRLDYQDIDPNTKFFFAAETETTHIGGLRIDFSEFVGLKAQYEHVTRGQWQGVDAVRTQLVFVF